MNARPFIDSLEFARNGQKIKGEVSVAELSRLHDMLANLHGQLSYELLGCVDKLGQFGLKLSVQGECQLTCQRCLKPYTYPVQVASYLILRDQAALDALGDEEDEFDSILAESHLKIAQLLEDEILLSLPIAPKHAVGDCQAQDQVVAATVEAHPFAMLAQLKK